MSKFSAHNLPRAQRIVDGVLDGEKGTKSIVVTTVDGFPVVSAHNAMIDPARIAAMASSIASIGVVVSEETGLGNLKSVIIECVDGFSIIIEIAHPKVPMVLVVVADHSALLGHLLYTARQVSQAIAMLD